MKIRSIRLKIAVAAALLSTLIVIAFASLSATRFYQEQLDVYSNDSAKKVSPHHLAEARSEVRELIGVYLLILPFIAAGAAAAAWWMAGRITRPLVDLAHAARQIDATNLHARLPLSNEDDEISQLTRILNEVLDRLEKSFRQASRFAADASHELRTPLTIMRGEIESAIQADPSAPQAPFLVSLLEENHHLSAITEKLLLLAKADAGRLMADSEPISLSDLLRDIAADISIIAVGQSMETTIAFGISVQGDAHLLRQLFWNLFANAASYNLPADGWIRSSLEADAQGIRFTIANSGDPIPSEVQERLFERFFRVSTARDRQSGGTGLGLSLCQEIVRAHGGALRLASSTSEGTEFICTFPAV